MVALAMAAAVTSRIGLGTATAEKILPVLDDYAVLAEKFQAE